MDSVLVSLSRTYRLSQELRTQNIVELNRFLFFIHAQEEVIESAKAAIEAFQQAASIAIECGDAELRDQLFGAIEMFRRKTKRALKNHESVFVCELRLFDGNAETLSVPALDPTQTFPKEDEKLSLTTLSQSFDEALTQIQKQTTVLESLRNEIKAVLHGAWQPHLASAEDADAVADGAAEAIRSMPRRAQSANQLDRHRAFALVKQSDE